MRICDSASVSMPVYWWAGTGTGAPRFFGIDVGSYSNDQVGLSYIERGLPGAGGVTSDGRNGNMVKYRNMRYYFRVYRTLTNTISLYNEQIRIVIYIDLQWSSTTRLTRADIFGTRLGTVSVFDPLNPDLAGRIIILRDIYLYFPPIANAGVDTNLTVLQAGAQDLFCHGDIDLSPFTGYFNGSGGSANIGNIQGCVCSNSGTAANYAVKMDYFCRLIYEEM